LIGDGRQVSALMDEVKDGNSVELAQHHKSLILGGLVGWAWT
jgi:hypothetical protein